MTAEWAIAGLVIIIVVALVLRRQIRLEITRQGVSLKIDVPRSATTSKLRQRLKSDKAGEPSG
jgi:hypothetical protein